MNVNRSIHLSSFFIMLDEIEAPYQSIRFFDAFLLYQYVTLTPTFIGFQVEFVADTLKLNLLELGKTGNRLISVVGKLDYQCPAGETHDPITFTTRESHLVSYCQFSLNGRSVKSDKADGARSTNRSGTYPIAPLRERCLLDPRHRSKLRN